jgi:hypothetical protein
LSQKDKKLFENCSLLASPNSEEVILSSLMICIVYILAAFCVFILFLYFHKDEYWGRVNLGPGWLIHSDHTVFSSAANICVKILTRSKTTWYQKDAVHRTKWRAAYIHSECFGFLDEFKYSHVSASFIKYSSSFSWDEIKWKRLLLHTTVHVCVLMFHV